MMTCCQCGSDYEGEVRFCPACGVALLPGESEPLPVASSGAADPYIGKVLLGQFEVRERIGAGAMGTVYSAWQTTMQRPVAIKVLRRELARDPAVVKRFYREARAAARLCHPNIVGSFLIGEC